MRREEKRRLKYKKCFELHLFETKKSLPLCCCTNWPCVYMFCFKCWIQMRLQSNQQAVVTIRLTLAFTMSCHVPFFSSLRLMFDIGNIMCSVIHDSWYETKYSFCYNTHIFRAFKMLRRQSVLVVGRRRLSLSFAICRCREIDLIFYSFFSSSSII